jgi:hypothetical protein
MARFYEDFGYTKGQNCVYTHSSKDIKRYRWLQRKMTDDYSVVYLPWFRFTLAKTGCEQCQRKSWEA